MHSTKEKPNIAVPSFRIVADYEERQQQLEKKKQVEMGKQIGSVAYGVCLETFCSYLFVYLYSTLVVHLCSKVCFIFIEQSSSHRWGVLHNNRRK